jgi:hypothetical protein
MALSRIASSLSLGAMLWYRLPLVAPDQLSFT